MDELEEEFEEGGEVEPFPVIEEDNDAQQPEGEPDGDQTEGDGVEGEPAAVENISRADYDALNERYQKLAGLEEFLPAIGDLGQFRQKIEQHQIDSSIRQIRGELQDAVDQEELSESAADEVAGMFAKMNARMLKAESALESHRAEQRTTAENNTVTALAAKYKYMDEATVRDAIKAGRDPGKEAERTHKRMQDAITAEVSQRATTRSAQPARKIKGDTGGGGSDVTAGTIPDPSNTKAFAKFLADNNINL